jgi:hypothetical protein
LGTTINRLQEDGTARFTESLPSPSGARILDSEYPDPHKWYYDMNSTPIVTTEGRLRARVDNDINTSLVNTRWYVNAGSDFDVEVGWELPSERNPNVENPSVSASGWILALEAREIDNDDNRLRMYIQGHNTRYVEQAYKRWCKNTNTG